MLASLIICMPIGYSSDALFSNVEVVRVDVSDEEFSEERLTRYVYGAGLVASVKDSEIKYYHSDRIQSNRLVTDFSGSVEKEFKSLPFGQEISNSEVRYAFATGKELDESDLYYFGARYYDSNLGRFTSVDPVPSEPAYQYVRNNPLNMVDPDGNVPLKIRFSSSTDNGYMILPKEKFIKVLEGIASNIDSSEEYCAGTVSLLYQEFYSELYSKWYNNIFNNKGYTKPLGVYGPAWNMRDNVLAAGGSMVLSSEMTKSKKRSFFRRLLSLFTLSKYTKSEPVRYDSYNGLESKLSTTIEIGDIVGLYYSNTGTDNRISASESLGENIYTHVALVVGHTDKGIPIVSHKFGHYLETESLNELLSGGSLSVVEIFRPNNPEDFNRETHKFEND